MLPHGNNKWIIINVIGKCFFSILAVQNCGQFCAKVGNMDRRLKSS